MQSGIKFALSVLAIGSVLLGAAPSFADTMTSIEVLPSVTDSSPSEPVASFSLALEHQAGLFAWIPQGTFDMIAKGTEDSLLVVHYKNEPYTATFTIRATSDGVAMGHEGWTLHVTRIDTIGNEPVFKSETSELKLYRNGPSIRLVSHGHYGLQARNLRLTFSLK